MPSLLHQLVQEPVEGGLPVPKQLKTEVDIARELKPLEAGITELGEPSLYACPECHGVLLEVKDGKNSRFRCHTGHAFSVNALLSDMDGRIEEALWNANRALQEKAMLLRHLAEHEEAREGGFGKELLERAEDTERRSEVLRRATFEQIDAAQPHIDQEAA
jgi:two-component system chemotaxis response regulator CheB